jgi:hypothetical protein
VGDSVVTLRDSANNVLSVTNIAATDNDDIPAPDATYNLDNTEGSTLFLGSIPSGDNETIIAPDGAVNNSDTTYTALVASGGVLALPDIDYTIVDENNVVLDTFTRPSLKNEIIDVTSYCAGATVENSDLSYVNTVASGGTLLLPDTNYDIFVAGSLTPISFSLPTLKNETINIVWQ